MRPSLTLALASYIQRTDQGICVNYTVITPAKSTSPVKIAANWAAIRTLAPDRFDAFKRPGDGDELDAIARYVWNMAVCRSLQPSLHTVEVTFRNQVNNALAALRGPTWYDIPGFLSPREMLMLNQAKTTLQRLHRPLDPGRVVAELNFGFWTQLYGQRHEQNIVRPTIQSVFPHYSGAAALQRSAVSAHLRDAKTLRNRITTALEGALAVRLHPN